MKRAANLTLVFSGLLVLLTLSARDAVQAAGTKRLTYAQAFEYAEPRLTKALPAVLGWADDGHYYELRTDSSDKVQKLYLVDAETGQATRYLNPEDFRPEVPRRFSILHPSAHTKDYHVLIFSRDHDLYSLNTVSKKFRRLTANPGVEKNPTLSPDGHFVAFTRDHNLFTIDLETGLEYQLTNDGSDVIYNGWASWVYYEEILGRSSRYRAFWWSPDGKRLAFLRFDDSPVPRFPIFHAGGVHGELEWERYPKAGDPNPRVRLGIVAAEGGKVVWADFDENADAYLAWPFWTPDGNKLTVQWMNRDQTDLIIYTVDPETGKKEQLYHEHQDTWVDFLTDLHFLEDGSGFLVHSDVDGWKHLYLYGMDGKLRKRLTKGNWQVRSVSLVDEKNGYVYFTADKGESWNTELFRVKLSGGKLEQLTQEPGTHSVRISPGGSYFIDTYSNITTPRKMLLRRADGSVLRVLGDSKKPEMDEYALGKTELFRIPISDGYRLPARWILPPDFDPGKRYPVILSIYGGPGMGTVRNAFPWGLSGFYLAQQGAIVLSIDHRGSGHFGKKGVAEMYRNLGKWEMHDWREAMKWVLKKPFVDTTHVAITGGSYGGYATLMALTVDASIFTHGVSLYPVTDWRLYDTVYTERYMDTPAQNPKGYEYGSVLTHADSLRGKLLIVHGTTDDNVHMQNTLQLVDKLELLGKQFNLMLYPEERHGIGRRRRHLSRLIVDFWVKNGFIRAEEGTGNGSVPQ